MKLEIYRIKQVKSKWQIIRPNGTIVNETLFDTEQKAKRHLGILAAYKYCITEEINYDP